MGSARKKNPKTAPNFSVMDIPSNGIAAKDFAKHSAAAARQQIAPTAYAICRISKTNIVELQLLVL